VFIPKPLLLETIGILSVIKVLEDILESSVILFQDGVLGGQVEGIFSSKSVMETLVGKLGD